MSTPTHNPHRPIPRFANPGRRARFSYLMRNKEGVLVRAWHQGLQDALPAAIISSLRGMVRP